MALDSFVGEPVAQGPVTDDTQVNSVGWKQAFDAANPPSMDIGANVQQAADDTSFEQRLNNLTKGQDDNNWRAKAMGWTQLIATGNPQLLFQINEQERKTQNYKQAAPVISEMHKLARSGEWDKATQVAQQGFAALGSRSPELGAFFQKSAEALEKQRDTWRDLQEVVKNRDLTWAEDDPRRKSLEALKIAIKNKTPMSQALLMDTIKEMSDLKVKQDETGRVILTAPSTGLSKSYQTESFIHPSLLDNQAGQMLAGELKLDIPNLTNLMNGQPYINTNGEKVTPSQAEVGAIRGRLAELTGRLGTEISAGRTPIDGVLAGFLNRAGATYEQVNARNVPRDIQETAYEMQRTEERNKHSAEFQARLDGPVVASGTGMNVIDRQTGQKQPMVSINYAGLNPDKFAVLNDKQSDLAQRYFTIRDRLNALKALVIPKLPGSQEAGQRFVEGVDNYLNRYLNFSPDITRKQAIQNVVKGDIEEYFNASGTSAARYADLTRSLTSVTASKESGTAAIDSLEKLLTDDHTRLLNQGNSANIPSGTKVSTSAIQSSTGTIPSEAWGVPTSWSQALLRNEGSTDTSVSPKGALSKWQVMPETAKQYGFTEEQLHNPKLADTIAKHIQGDLAQKYPGRPDLFLAAYFSGPGNVANGQIINPSKRAIVNGRPIGPTVQEYVDKGVAQVNALERSLPTQGSQPYTVAPTQTPIKTTLPQGWKAVN